MSDADVPPLLLLADDPSDAAALTSVLAETVRVRVSCTFEEGSGILAGPDRLCGALIDSSMSGIGLDALEATRTARPRLPVLVLTDGNADDVKRAYRLGAACLCKPWERIDVMRFARSAARGRRCVCPAMVGSLERFARTHGLTRRQSETLLLRMQNLDRDDIAAKMGVSIETVKKQIRHILDRTGACRLDDVVRQIRFGEAGN